VAVPTAPTIWDGRALLVIKDAQGKLLQARYTTGSGWSLLGHALGPSGEAFTVSDAPGVVRGRMPGDLEDTMYLHAQNDAGGSSSARLLKRSVEGRWVPTSFYTGSTDRRPGLAYVPHATDPSKGKLYAVYRDGGRVLRLRTSTVSINPSTLEKTPSFGFVSAFDNIWATAHGVDLMFEPGKDTNLRAAIVYDFGQWDQRVVFQPLADGIVDLSYGSFDDWTQMGRRACASVANPGGLVPSPIPCF
jgi:hypothetical protein